MVIGLTGLVSLLEELQDSSLCNIFKVRTSSAKQEKALTGARPCNNSDLQISVSTRVREQICLV